MSALLLDQLVQTPLHAAERIPIDWEGSEPLSSSSSPAVDALALATGSN